MSKYVISAQNDTKMNAIYCIFLCVVTLLHQVLGQVVVDTFDPTKPRPGATLPASIDPYGWSRPLPPNIDPLGFSYRPAVPGAALPALYDPFGASRYGGIPITPDAYGTGGRYGGYGGNYGWGGYGNYGFPRPGAYPSLPGYTPWGMDNWTGYRPTLTTNVGSPIIPENTAATLVSNTPLNYPPPPPPQVINTLPVAVPVPVNTVSVPAVTPVNTVPVAAPAPAFNPMSFNGFAGNGLPNFGGNAGGFQMPAMGGNGLQMPGMAGNGGGLQMTGMGGNGGGMQMPGLGGNAGNLQMPGMGMNTGNLQMPNLGMPLGGGGTTNTGNANPSPLLPPISS